MITEYIEEIIEESYLLGLSENEIKANLDRFVETCSKVIRENVHDRKQMQELAEKLARARALSLIEDQEDGDDVEAELEALESSKSSRELFAEKVARNKRLILRAIGDCDSKLVGLIEKERFPGKVDEPLPTGIPITGQGKRNKAKDLFLKACYVATLLFVLLLVYLVLLQNL